MAKIGRVDLQQQAGTVDGEILVAHLARESGQVRLLGIVIRIEHRRGDDAGRRRSHEALGESARVASGTLETIDLAR